MAEANKPQMRIDWFDGTVMEDTRPTTSGNFADEEQQEPSDPKPQFTERKAIGYKRLFDISLINPPVLILEVANRPGFWNLFDQDELKGDFIVLIVRILANILKHIDPDEETKIITLLRTRFLKSEFIEKLKIYLIGLPDVRVVEKRLNIQLWDDVENFYFKVIDLCKGLRRLEGVKCNALINDLLDALEISAIGVSKEHSERFSDKLFKEISDLKSETEAKEDDWESLEPVPTDPDNYKNLNIFPTRKDLLTNETVKIRPNIINGAYVSTEDYLDLHFKLIREDFFGPLREGICKYMKNPSEEKIDRIRVFLEVRVLRTYVCNNKIGHLVDTAYRERLEGKKVKRDKKFLMYGSLVLFTNDNFETILCATVIDTGEELQMAGYLGVSFQNPVSKEILNKPYLMVESEVFFEPYHQGLYVLQNMKLEHMPMKKYIIDVKSDVQPPAYLSHDTIYTTITTQNEEVSIPLLNTEQWPSLPDLDHSQLEAYKFALTREFAVIQGPPGTGKTYLGVKIASTLLNNLSLEGTPMVVICFTNETLDQFLEGILGVTKSLVRIGSQIRSKKIEPYTLNSLRAKIKCQYSRLYIRKKKELEKLYNEMTELETDIEKCDNNILTYGTLKPYLKINGKEYELTSTKEDPILCWLLGHLRPEESQNREYYTIEGNYRVSSSFSETWAINQIRSLASLLMCVDELPDAPRSEETTNKVMDHILKLKKRLECFQDYKELHKSRRELHKIKEVDDLYDLSVDERWQLYYNCARQLQDQLLSNMDILLEKHKSLNAELEEVTNLIDCEVLKTTRVVGLTTTASARRHKLMQQLKSSIVIVEEAAEIPEAHIVAALTHHCQHLILIGDHQQLTPMAAHYYLARDYNLEISLFERMIINGVHVRTLTTQRRMRSKFTDLLVPTIYEKLDNHPSVLAYPKIKGLKDELFFFDHEESEDVPGIEDRWSQKNMYEAKWCASLANYLRKMKYKAKDIAILSTYVAQVALIQQISQRYELLRNVTIMPVDSFQGKESRIVILSLVRSNKEGRIGFLNMRCRICVALSRAKEGFYIFGNMTLLKSVSDTWNAINEKLIKQKAIGNKITITTKNGENIDIAVSEELDKIQIEEKNE